VIARKKGLPFRFDETALEIISKTKVLRTSDDLGWPNVNVSLIAGEADEYPLVHQAVPDLWLAMNRAPTELALVAGGRKWDLSAADSWTSVIAPGTPVLAYIRGESTILHAFVRRQILAEVAGELFERDVKSLEIDTNLGVDDPGLASLLHSVELSLFEPAGDADLKVEYLARALAAHVLRKNAYLMRAEPAADIPLTYRQVRLVKDYIQDHLSSKIVLKDLAALLNLGQTSLMKRFRGSFRQTPHQYIMEMRVSRARELLERSNLPIAQIAALCGFSDQTHLGVAFRQIVGVTPSQYRRTAQ